jgi:hypothetical protein
VSSSGRKRREEEERKAREKAERARRERKCPECDKKVIKDRVWNLREEITLLEYVIVCTMCFLA